MTEEKKCWRRIEQSDGNVAYLHRLKPLESLENVTPPTATDAGHLDMVYTDLLTLLPLPSETQKADLLRRGFSAEEINKRGYRNYEGGKKCWDLADRLHNCFGEIVYGVPGFQIRQSKKGNLYRTLMQTKGLLIPVRNAQGGIEAIKIRRPPGEDEGGRYICLSSNHKEWRGPKAQNTLHVPIGTKLDDGFVRVTEGPLKADVCAALGTIPTVGLPSAGSWKCLIEFLNARPHIATVRVALDGDFRTNDKVGHSLARLIAEVRKLGREPLLEVWDFEKAKGIDDALAAGLETTVLDPMESQRIIDSLPQTNNDNPGPSNSISSSSQLERSNKPNPPKSPAIRCNKALNDPFQLARTFLTLQHTLDGRLTLRNHREVWYRWERGCWQSVATAAVENRIMVHCEQVFNGHNIYSISEMNDAKKKVPEALRVTASLVRDVMKALGAETYLEHDLESPAWIEREYEIDPTDCLFAPNGIIHLPTFTNGDSGYLFPPTPNLFNTSALPFDFNPRPPTAIQWAKFLNETWPGDPDSINSLQEFFGLCLTSQTHYQKMLMIVGPARSGKGTIATMLKALVGDANTATPTLGSLGERFGLWPLYEKTLAIVPDAHLSGRADASMITERLKSISGEDPQMIDRKMIAPLMIQLKTRFVILANGVPKFRDSSSVIASRFIVLQTKKSHSGKEDLTLKPRLLKELPGILSWAIAGLTRLTERGYFRQPESAEEAKNQMVELAASIAGFFDECCIANPEGRVPICTVYQKYLDWCKANGVMPPLPTNLFSRDLKAYCPQISTSRPRDAESDLRTRYFTGVELR